MVGIPVVALGRDAQLFDVTLDSGECLGGDGVERELEDTKVNQFGHL